MRIKEIEESAQGVDSDMRSPPFRCLATGGNHFRRRYGASRL